MPTFDHSPSDNTPAEPSNGHALEVTACWERPIVPTAGGTTALLVRVRALANPAAGGRRAPVDVAFVLDRSGSMSGRPLELVKQAVDVAVGYLGEEDRAALVVYDHAVETLQRLETATPRVKTALRLALHGLDARGSTDLAGGWLAGCGQLAAGMGATPDAGAATGVRIRRALLLTDGLANVGITDPGALTTHAHELRRRGVGTTTLGVGIGFDEDLLSGMAEAGGGNFQYIEQADQIRAFFARELSDLLTVAAAGLTLSLTMPHGVRATLVNPFPVERHGKRLEIALRDLPAGDELDLVFVVTARPGQPGALHHLELVARWSDPAADARRGEQPVLPPLRYADREEIAATPADPVVAEQAALQHAAAERRAAMRLDRSGRHAESRAGLRRAAALLQAAPQTDAVREDLDGISEAFTFEASAPLPEETRKRSTWDAHRRARGKRNE